VGLAVARWGGWGSDGSGSTARMGERKPKPTDLNDVAPVKTYGRLTM